MKEQGKPAGRPSIRTAGLFSAHWYASLPPPQAVGRAAPALID
jgi:hypothetical protein